MGCAGTRPRSGETLIEAGRLPYLPACLSVRPPNPSSSSRRTCLNHSSSPRQTAHHPRCPALGLAITHPSHAMPHMFREYRAAHRSPRPDTAACSDCVDTPMPAVVPAAIHDDMSFAAMCEALEAYCTCPPRPPRRAQPSRSPRPVWAAVRGLECARPDRAGELTRCIGMGGGSCGQHRASAELGGHEAYHFESGRAACREEYFPPFPYAFECVHGVLTVYLSFPFCRAKPFHYCRLAVCLPRSALPRSSFRETG